MTLHIAAEQHAPAPQVREPEQLTVHEAPVHEIFPSQPWLPVHWTSHEAAVQSIVDPHVKEFPQIT
jgi:hypothetical protein